jgi:hypothetical protein
MGESRYESSGDNKEEEKRNLHHMVIIYLLMFRTDVIYMWVGIMFGNGMEPFFILLLKLWTQESTSSHLRLYMSSETLCKGRTWDVSVTSACIPGHNLIFIHDHGFLQVYIRSNIKVPSNTVKRWTKWTVISPACISCVQLLYLCHEVLIQTWKLGWPGQTIDVNLLRTVLQLFYWQENLLFWWYRMFWWFRGEERRVKFGSVLSSVSRGDIQWHPIQKWASQVLHSC